MTFLQLFVAILIVTDALSALPAAAIGSLMVVLNALVIVYNVVSVLAEACMDYVQDINLDEMVEVLAYGSATAAAAAAAKAANSPRKKKKVLDDVTATLHTDFSNQDIVISEVRRLSVSPVSYTHLTLPTICSV